MQPLSPDAETDHRFNARGERRQPPVVDLCPDRPDDYWLAVFAGSPGWRPRAEPAPDDPAAWDGAELPSVETMALDAAGLSHREDLIGATGDLDLRSQDADTSAVSMFYRLFSAPTAPFAEITAVLYDPHQPLWSVLRAGVPAVLIVSDRNGLAGCAWTGTVVVCRPMVSGLDVAYPGDDWAAKTVETMYEASSAPGDA